MKRLNGWDAMLLYSETPNVHKHTLKIGIIDAADFDGEFTFEFFRTELQRRLHRLEPLRLKLVHTPMRLHHPMWSETSDIDLDYHLHRVRVRAPGGRRELDELIGDIAGTPLDRRHPLWEMYFVEGMGGNRFAVVGKIHHALADGVASANLMAKMMDQSPINDVPDTDDEEPSPSRGELLQAAWRDHVRQFGKLPTLARETAAGIRRVRSRVKERGAQAGLSKQLPPPTFINHVVTPGRRFATATLALSDVKETSKALGVTLNDVVLASAAGALRELLLRRDGHADAPLIVSVPVGLDTSPDRLTGNDVFGLNASLPVHIADPLERVRLTSSAMRIAKEDLHLMGGETMAQWASYLPPNLSPPIFRWVARREAQSRMMNLLISNVPGPRERGSTGGATVSEIYSVGPLLAGSGMNITVWSYVDQLNISVLTDDVTLDDAHEATDAMVRGFVELRAAAGLSTELTEVLTAMAPASAN
ncbi:wax ester/triacylglycerol synthase family O-acyltransferase [Mycobacterium sp. URHB0044]|uniref:WS/DGAT/MGAT family O-acyltransferase n=1 Tax=Mycobacterium sp. URHB0044 TaxID=1380386 RepID=UPI00049111AE|nr:wax ester/triacylglycerol synthase family O-acyltransferase [Mycobacterium sp. URHB0044]